MSTAKTMRLPKKIHMSIAWMIRTFFSTGLAISLGLKMLDVFNLAETRAVCVHQIDVVNEDEAHFTKQHMNSFCRTHGRLCRMDQDDDPMCNSLNYMKVKNIIPLAPMLAIALVIFVRNSFSLEDLPSFVLYIAVFTFSIMLLAEVYTKDRHKVLKFFQPTEQIFPRRFVCKLTLLNSRSGFDQLPSETRLTFPCIDQFNHLYGHAIRLLVLEAIVLLGLAVFGCVVEIYRLTFEEFHAV